MKKLFLFATVCMAMVVACTPEPVTPPNNGGNDETPSGEKSTSCDLISISVASEDGTIEGQIFMDKKVELTYNPEQLPILKNGTATIVVSEKATYVTKPETVTDWSTGTVELTVTAEDGEHSTKYEIYAQERVYTVSIARVDSASTDKMGGVLEAHYGGNCHAFSGVDHIVDCGGNVFDIHLNKVGTLNMSGISGEIAALGNDDNGVLIASVAYGDEDCTTAPEPTAENSSYASFIAGTKFFAWKNGWEQAPEVIYTPSSQGNYAQFINVSGDINKTMIVNGYAASRIGDHHNWVFTNGEISWENFATGVMDNRPDLSPNIVAAAGSYFYAGFLNGWTSSGQNMCSTSGDVNDIYVLASAAPEWDGNTDGSWWRLGGAVVYAYDKINGTKVEMPATLSKPLVSDELKHAGVMRYGNTDFCPAVKTFKFNGNTFAAIAHVGVQDEYFTVHNVDYYFGKSQQQYLRQTIRGVDDANKATNMKPSVAYIYNPSEDAGYIVVGYIHGVLDATGGAYAVYKVTRKAIE